MVQDEVDAHGWHLWCGCGRQAFDKRYMRREYVKRGGRFGMLSAAARLCEDGEVRLREGPP